MSPAAAPDVTVRVADEMRALFRAYRARGGDVAWGLAPRAPELSSPVSAREPTIERLAAAPAGPQRLMRAGKRPLAFEGALAMRVSTQDASAGAAFWHELSVYVLSEGGVVAHAALRPSDAHAERIAWLSCAERVDDPEAFEAFLLGFDPADAFVASDAPDALAEIDAARRDFTRLVAAFCGPTHTAARAVAARLQPQRRAS